MRLLLKVLFCSIIGSTISSSALRAQDEPPELTKKFEESWASGDTGGFVAEGVPEFRRSSLFAIPELKLKRPIQAGFRGLLSFEPVLETTQGLPIEFIVRFRFAGGNAAEFQLVSRKGDLDKFVGTILLQSGKTNEEPRSQFFGRIDESTPVAEVRHGICRLIVGETELMAFGEEIVEEIEGLDFEFRQGGVRELKFEATAPRSHTPEQMAQLLHCRELDNEAKELFGKQLYRESFGKLISARDTARSAAGAFSIEHYNSMVGLTRVAGDTRHPNAQSFFDERLKLAETLFGAEHPRTAEAQNSASQYLSAVGKYRPAIELLEKCTQTWKRVLDVKSSDYAAILYALAGAHRSLGELDRAQQLMEETISIEKETLGEEHPEFAQSLNTLAMIHENRGEYDEALQLFQRSSNITRAALGPQSSSYGLSLVNQAAVYRSMRRLAEAAELYGAAKEILQKELGEAHPHYGVLLNNMAAVYVDMGDRRRALELFLEALKVRRAAVGIHPDVAQTLINLSGVYRSIGQLDQAVEALEQALEILESTVGTKYPEYGLATAKLGVLQRIRGDSQKALQSQLKALQLVQSILGPEHRNVADLLEELSDTYVALGEFDKATECMLEARNINAAVYGTEHPAYASVLAAAADLRRASGDFAIAAPMLMNALSITRGQLDQLSALQSERQQLAMQRSRRSQLNSLLNCATHGAGDPAEVLEMVWRWKGAVTRRQRAYRLLSAEPELEGALKKLRSVTQELSSHLAHVPEAGTNSSQQIEPQREKWKTRLEDLVREREDVESELASASRQFRIATKQLTVADIQARLEPDEAFIDFVEYNEYESGKTSAIAAVERRYIAFVVRGGEPVRLVRLGSVSEITSEILKSTDWSEKLANSGYDGRTRLRKLVWEPIERHLTGIRTAILSPDTVLGTLPFVALPAADTGLLIEKYRLVRVPFAQFLHEESDATPGSDQSLLVVGDVDYGTADTSPGSDWLSLAGFQEEFRAVRQLFETQFKTARMQTLSGSAATENRLLELASQFRTLHVITHGQFDNPEPGMNASLSEESIESAGAMVPSLLSGLVMANANLKTAIDSAEDGVLRASEIESSSMKNVDLVVLSACETGLGRATVGEGLTGLQRAFHIAGARSVVASLWKVDDRATQELMRQFYTNLWIKKQPKIDALRNAQLWMLKHPQELESMGVQGATTRGKPRDLRKTNPQRTASEAGQTDPYFWASFQLSGDWR